MCLRSSKLEHVSVYVIFSLRIVGWNAIQFFHKSLQLSVMAVSREKDLIFTQKYQL